VSVFQVDLSTFQENSSDKVGSFRILRKSTETEKLFSEEISQLMKKSSERKQIFCPKFPKKFQQNSQCFFFFNWFLRLDPTNLSVKRGTLGSSDLKKTCLLAVFFWKFQDLSENNIFDKWKIKSLHTSKRKKFLKQRKLHLGISHFHLHLALPQYWLLFILKGNRLCHSSKTDH